MKFTVDLAHGYEGFFELGDRLGLDVRSLSVPASPREIDTVRSLASEFNGAELPGEYEEFLRHMGGRAPLPYGGSYEVFLASSVISLYRWRLAAREGGGPDRVPARCICPGDPALSIIGGSLYMPTGGPECGFLKWLSVPEAPPAAQSMLAQAYTMLLDAYLGEVPFEASADIGFPGDRLELGLHLLAEIGCELVFNTPRFWYLRHEDVWFRVSCSSQGDCGIVVSAVNRGDAVPLLDRLLRHPEYERLSVTGTTGLV